MIDQPDAKLTGREDGYKFNIFLRRCIGKVSEQTKDF